MAKPHLFKKYQRVELRIEDLAFEGKGIARISTEEGQYVVFVPNTIPGQLVQAKMQKVKARYAEGKLLKVLENSPEEVEVSYHRIPGAPYISLPVERQHYYKRKTTVELFSRIGKLKESEALLDEFIPSPIQYHYRNKMEYSFAAVVYDPQHNGNDRRLFTGF
ncbi:MAG: TRAM domain-containing protein [Owenweeksia sp.]|nr:TRAM domain-containing protein [Owenweeksia sp.]